MKVAIVGAGAMGSIYAGLMADAGNEVWALDTWAEHIEAIQQNGLRVEGASGDRLVKSVQASTDTSAPGICDLVIIATKASGVESAAKSLGPLLRDDTLVLTIQNGVGAGERISQHMPADNVLLGVAQGFGASMKGTGPCPPQWHEFDPHWRDAGRFGGAQRENCRLVARFRL